MLQLLEQVLWFGKNLKNKLATRSTNIRTGTHRSCFFYPQFHKNNSRSFCSPPLIVADKFYLYTDKINTGKNAHN